MLLYVCLIVGVHLQACPFVRPCHFDKIDNNTYTKIIIIKLGKCGSKLHNIYIHYVMYITII